MINSTRTTAIALLLSVAGGLACADQDRHWATADVLAVVDDYRSRHEKAFLKDFAGLLGLRNVATNLDDMQANADRIVAMLEPRGFRIEVLEAGGAPYVYAELMTPGAAETVMIYAHFDGQPVQAENWAFPPFEPTLLDAPIGEGGKPVDIDAHVGPFEPESRIYARSAGDDKMPIVAVLYAIDALREAGIPMSVNVKLFLDGEEEIGSPTVGKVLDANKALLASDLLLFCDGPMHQSRRPQLVFGVRGTTSVDLTTYGATRPLHSGHYGNWSPNPVMRLAHLLTSMRDESGRILIDGYYDDVTPLGEAERAAIAEMPDVTVILQDELAVHTPEGDGRRIEDLVALPALNVRGFIAGGVGEQGRNIVLSKATASIDLRLVPGQTVAGVRRRLESHLRGQGFHVVNDDPQPAILRAHEKVVKVAWDDGYAAYRTPMDDPAAARLVKLMREIAPDLILTPNMGGSLPLYEFGDRLDAPIVILPLANHDNNQHAENENIRLTNLWNAIRVYAAVLAGFGGT